MALFSAGGSSCHFVSTRTISIGRQFLLFPRHTFSSFQGRSFSRPYFCFFSCSCRIVSVILAYFSRLLSSAISSLFLRKARILMEFLSNMAALNALFYRGRKLFRGLHAHAWLQESSFGDRSISQTNPSVFSRIHEPPWINSPTCTSVLCRLSTSVNLLFINQCKFIEYK
jgi:hypothetical protein